jgi:hypothetical protein
VVWEGVRGLIAMLRRGSEESAGTARSPPTSKAVPRSIITDADESLGLWWRRPWAWASRGRPSSSRQFASDQESTCGVLALICSSSSSKPSRRFFCLSRYAFCDRRFCSLLLSVITLTYDLRPPFAPSLLSGFCDMSSKQVEDVIEMKENRRAPWCSGVANMSRKSVTQQETNLSLIGLQVRFGSVSAWQLFPHYTVHLRSFVLADETARKP